MRIDFVLGSQPLAERVTGAFIGRDERDPAQGSTSPSDHAPVVVELSD
jgi:exodeoxyribonuclease-3